MRSSWIKSPHSNFLKESSCRVNLNSPINGENLPTKSNITTTRLAHSRLLNFSRIRPLLFPYFYFPYMPSTLTSPKLFPYTASTPTSPKLFPYTASTLTSRKLFTYKTFTFSPLLSAHLCSNFLSFYPPPPLSPLGLNVICYLYFMYMCVRIFFSYYYFIWVIVVNF